MKYAAFGVGLESDLALTDLPAALGNEPLTIRLERGQDCDPEARDEAAYTERRFHDPRILACPGPGYDLKVEGVGRFRLLEDPHRIALRPLPQASEPVLRYWSLRFMLPLYLASQGHAMLFHGSAVNMGGRTVAFLADSFGGKSTLANYLEQRGHPLITDDDLRIDEDVRHGFMATPSIPFVRANRTLHDLGRRVEHFGAFPTPLRKIYRLELSAGSDPPRVIPLKATEAMASLLQNYRFRLRRRVMERFRFSARMVSHVPFARLIVPRDIARLAEVRAALLRDMGECA